MALKNSYLTSWTLVLLLTPLKSLFNQNLVKTVSDCPARDNIAYNETNDALNEVSATDNEDLI